MFKNKLGKKSNKSYEDILYSCTIRFLDDADPLSVTFQKDTKGDWLIDYVCKELNLVEKDYFGLRFVDSDKQRHWLDPFKTVHRQLKNVNPMVLCFRVKFYPTDPKKLKEEITRYFLFLQLRRDLHHGRLLCSPTDANLLAAYVIQSECGDYDPQDHPPGYVSEFKMLPKQTQKQEEKIAELHKTLRGQVPAEAEANFLSKASSLDTYGVDPHPVKDQRSNQMYLGVTHLGIVTFQGNKRTHLFKWPQITKIAFEGKMFIVHVTVSEGEENSMLFKRKKHACGFKCPTYSACKHLWKCAVEQQYFFTLAQASLAPKVTSGGGIFSRGSKFRFSGRCQKEVFAESASISRDPPQFVRSALSMQNFSHNHRSCSNPNFVRSFNQLRSASLPNKLRDKSLTSHDIRDVMIPLDSAIQSSVSTSALERPKSVNLSQSIAEGIPEEKPVDIGEAYEPLQSPAREDLPPLPGAVAPSLDEPPDDVDAQIEQLEAELDRCKGTDNNHVDSPSDDIQQNSPAFAQEKERQDTDSLPVTAEEPCVAETASARKVPLCRSLILSLAIVFIVLIVIAVLVLESELDVPVLRDLRNMPQVQDFKIQLYRPFKSTLQNKMNSLFYS